jgi:hypothetical protein
VGTVFRGGLGAAREWACERERRAWRKLGGGCSLRGMEAARQKCERLGAPSARRAVRPRGELQMGDSERAGKSTPSPSNLTRRARRRPARHRGQLKATPLPHHPACGSAPGGSRS